MCPASIWIMRYPPGARVNTRGGWFAAPQAWTSYGAEVHIMGVVLVVLLLALILGGAGFALHALWWIALIVLAVWLVGFLVRSGESARWYRW